MRGYALYYYLALDDSYMDLFRNHLLILNNVFENIKYVITIFYKYIKHKHMFIHKGQFIFF